MHTKILSYAAQERSGLRSWYSLFGFIQCDSFQCASFQCASCQCMLTEFRMASKRSLTVLDFLLQAQRQRYSPPSWPLKIEHQIRPSMVYVTLQNVYQVHWYMLGNLWSLAIKLIYACTQQLSYVFLKFPFWHPHAYCQFYGQFEPSQPSPPTIVHPGLIVWTSVSLHVLPIQLLLPLPLQIS